MCKSASKQIKERDYFFLASSWDVRPNSNVVRTAVLGTINFVVFLGFGAAPGILRLRSVRASGVALRPGTDGRPVGDSGDMPSPRGGRGGKPDEEDTASGEVGAERICGRGTWMEGRAGAVRIGAVCAATAAAAVPSDGPSKQCSSSSASASSFESADVVSSSSESEPGAQTARV